MRFYVPDGFEVTLLEDDGDVNICVNGDCVAWFDKDSRCLMYNPQWLKEEGLGVKEDVE